MPRLLLLSLLLLAAAPSAAQTATSGVDALHAAIDEQAAALEDQVITWRRHVHQYPELSNREHKTAAYVAEHLRALGIEVQTGMAHTGVVGLLRGGMPGPVVALRADMDALPVTERVDVPFASKETAVYDGQEVGVMHACGHDTHVAVLMGVAEILAGMKDELPGTVKFIFQPAEEGAPPGEEGGADLMVAEGVLDDPAPDAIFGLHATPRLEAGQVGYRAEGLLAAADIFRVIVHGQQTHAAYPWAGRDPIVTSAQIIQGLQTIISRQSQLITAPAVVSVGRINGGVRNNIIPDSVFFEGTIRTLDEAMRTDIHERVRRTAEKIAESAGLAADVTIRRGTPVTYNDPALVERMAPTLQRVAGPGQAQVVEPVLGAEDFAYFQQEIPGLYFWMGIRTPGSPESDFAPNHSPLFRVDEAALQTGVRALANLAVDYLAAAN